MRNVARCWTYETSVILGKQIKDELPFNNYFEFFGPDYCLHITPSNMENRNTRKSLDAILEKLMDVLNNLESVPGIQATTLDSAQAPDAPNLTTSKLDDDEANPDERTEKAAIEAKRQHVAEMEPDEGDKDVKMAT